MKGDRWLARFLLVAGFCGAWFALVAGVWAVVPFSLAAGLVGLRLHPDEPVAISTVAAWFLIGLLTVGAGAGIAYALTPSSGSGNNNGGPTCKALGERKVSEPGAFAAYYNNGCTGDVEAVIE